MDDKTKEMLAQLKLQRDTLRLKIEKIDQQTDKNWNVFRMEIQKDVQQFARDANGFFMKKEK